MDSTRHYKQKPEKIITEVFDHFYTIKIFHFFLFVWFIL